MSVEERRSADHSQRRRVLAGLATCLGEHGYAATTIADIAAAAEVSKSTFYAHFEDKQAAFLALYVAGADLVLGVIEQEDAAARAAGLGWRERVEVVAAAYFRALAEGGEVTRSLLGEISGISAQSHAVRRRVLDRYVDLLGRLAEEVAARRPELHAPSRDLLLAGIGGMNELMLRAVEDGEAPRLEQLTAAATELVVALLQSPDS